MKKRGVPIYMVVVLVILVGVVAIANLKSTGVIPESKASYTDHDSPPPPSASEDKVRKAMTSPAPGGHPAQMQGPTQPTVAKEKHEAYKPKPSENGTDSQWYGN